MGTCCSPASRDILLHLVELALPARSLTPFPSLARTASSGAALSRASYASPGSSSAASGELSRASFAVSPRSSASAALSGGAGAGGAAAVPDVSQVTQRQKEQRAVIERKIAEHTASLEQLKKMQVRGCALLASRRHRNDVH